MGTTPNSYALYRKAKLQQGAEFLDFIMERQHRIGVVLQTYCSKAGQSMGENLLGLEIKNDARYQETGNLCIEAAEKAVPREGDYVASGIFRNDNSWLYGIGDRLNFWIFAITLLRHFYQRRKELGFRDYEKPTSRGYLLPITKADQHCARKLIFGFDGEILEVKCGEQACSVDLSSNGVPVDLQYHLRLK